jgi:hypothetical protein
MCTASSYVLILPCTASEYDRFKSDRRETHSLKLVLWVQVKKATFNNSTAGKTYGMHLSSDTEGARAGALASKHCSTQHLIYQLCN